jgi:hypothetical protein
VAKILFLVFLGILALNVLVILAITGILIADHWRSRRKERNDDAPAKAS